MIELIRLDRLEFVSAYGELFQNPGLGAGLTM
jgi:hypothetical protein